MPSDQSPRTIPAVRPLPLAATRQLPTGGVRRAVQNCSVPERPRRRVIPSFSFLSFPSLPLRRLPASFISASASPRGRPVAAATAAPAPPPLCSPTASSDLLLTPYRSARRRAPAPPWPAAVRSRIWGPVVKRPASSVPLDVSPLPRRRHCVRTPPLPQLLLASLPVWFVWLLCTSSEEGIGLVGFALLSSVL